MQSIIGLRRDQLDLQRNQQQFNQSDTSLRRGGEMDAQRISNNRSQFEIDRAKGFMPHELRMAGIQGDAAHQNLYDQKQQSSFNADMNKYDLQGRGMDMEDRITSRYSNSKTYSAPSLGGFGGGFGGLGSSGFSTPAIQSSYSYGDHKPVYKTDPKPYANGGAVVSFSDLEPASVAGRMQTRGPGMKEYNENYAFGKGTGRARAPQDFRKAPRTLADGGPVQDVQAKGFVPVMVSNGEFEFTPEQVANIGAAMLASKEQVPA